MATHKQCEKLALERPCDLPVSRYINCMSNPPKSRASDRLHDEAEPLRGIRAARKHEKALRAKALRACPK